MNSVLLESDLFMTRLTVQDRRRQNASPSRFCANTIAGRWPTRVRLKNS
ncbi:hypothetical protein J4732_14825 [Serratia marcescens]|uniref:Uncharacterized protein n=1 Tax=Serratia marcescens TaxID=615 RepID=A0A939NM96_SERMA|nr:hypothetical protein [Serratia marcescens]